MTKHVEALLASKEREATQSSQHFCASSEPSGLTHTLSQISGARSMVESFLPVFTALYRMSGQFYEEEENLV